MYQFIIENVLLEHTFHSPIPLRRETAWIMLFQGLADMGIHWKRRKLVKGHKADAVRHFHADAVKLQKLVPGLRVGHFPEYSEIYFTGCYPKGRVPDIFCPVPKVAVPKLLFRGLT